MFLGVVVPYVDMGVGWIAMLRADVCDMHVAAAMMHVAYALDASLSVSLDR